MGLDVKIEELEKGKSGEYVFNGQKVLVYIREQYAGIAYKFHLCECKTISGFIARNRYERYVVSTRTDGLFNVINRRSGEEIEKEIEMEVCMNCLSEINYKGYKNDYYKRNNIYKNFSLSDYLSKNETKHKQLPRHNDRTAPINDYTDDWEARSKEYREDVNWRCEECNKDLSHKELRQYLHVHHKDGKKYNNYNANLKALCIECHSKKHEHMDRNKVRNFRSDFRRIDG
ncbi:MAG: hypothetical protein GF419_04375 [Ignavibacteriales bacterium]|nr:hypothetical protein [Ignavibacteriales bacterium]